MSFLLVGLPRPTKAGSVQMVQSLHQSSQCLEQEQTLLCLRTAFAVSCMVDKITRDIHEAHASGCNITAGWRTLAGIPPLHSTAQCGTCTKCECSVLFTTSNQIPGCYLWILAPCWDKSYHIPK